MNSQTGGNQKHCLAVRRILDTATKVFAEQGFAGARVDEIARRAGINKAMIYYRIGDKQAVYGEVLHDIFSATAERVSRNIEASQSPEEKLRTFIRNIMHTMGRHRLAPIMMRELASGAASFPHPVAKDLSRIVGTLVEILKEGQTKGVFKATNPILFHMMIVGTVVFYKMSHPLRTDSVAFAQDLRNLDCSVAGDENRDIENLLLAAIAEKPT